MTTSLGPFLTAWTIRAALACFVLYLAGEYVLPNVLSPRVQRLIWTLGCVLFDVHVASAFHFSYFWSHSVAWLHTAQRTDAMLGVPFGGGIYFSYAFLILWWLDVWWLWLRPLSPSTLGEAMAGEQNPASPRQQEAIRMPMTQKPLRRPVWRSVLHAYLIFIAFQGAIVFEAGPTRRVGMAVCVAIVSLVLWRMYNTAAAAPDDLPQGL